MDDTTALVNGELLLQKQKVKIARHFSFISRRLLRHWFTLEMYGTVQLYFGC